jgi:hypothetical protein
MFHDPKESKAINPRERELIVAYLSYALDDVRALSDVGSHFLRLTIATLTEEAVPDNDSPLRLLHPTATH